MASTEDYRCTDYDMDPDFDRTTSWPDGLHEMDRFEPYLLRPVRRISTDADIQRYKNHFSIAQRNQGLSWKQYLRILRADLHQFDTRDLETKALQRHLTSSWNSKKLHGTASKLEFFKKPESRFKILKRNSFVKTQTVGDTDSVSSMEYASTFSKKLSGRFASPRESGISHYVTASGSEFSLPAYQVTKKSSFDKTECIGDTDSVSSMTTCITMNSISPATDSSMNNSVSFSPQKNLLKKFCSGIRRFAVRTKQTVEKLSVNTKQCPTCGNSIGDVKTHEERSQSVLNVFDFKRPPTPSMITNNNNLGRTTSKTSLISIGSGECAVRSQLTKKTTSTYQKKEKIKRMSPFVE